MSRSLRRSLGRIGRWPRLLAAGTCLLLALASTLDARRTVAKTGAAGAGVPVVVAAKTLPVGHILARRDLAVARWPARLVPAGARGDPLRLVGQRLAGTLAGREPITPGRLVGAGLADHLGPHVIATPVALDTDVHVFVRAGDRVDLVTAPRSGADGRDPAASTSQPARSGTIVGQHLLVLAVYRSDDSTLPSSVVVLATPRELALRIVAERAAELFTIVIDPP